MHIYKYKLVSNLSKKTKTTCDSCMEQNVSLFRLTPGFINKSKTLKTSIEFPKQPILKWAQIIVLFVLMELLLGMQTELYALQKKSNTIKKNSKNDDQYRIYNHTSNKNILMLKQVFIPILTIITLSNEFSML